jgi:uncharacterized protein YkwD
MGLILLLAACTGKPSPSAEPTQIAASATVVALPATSSAIPTSVAPTPPNPPVGTATTTPGVTASPTPLPPTVPPASATPAASVTSPTATTPPPTQAPTSLPASPTASASETPVTSTGSGSSAACSDVAAFYGDLTIPDDTFFYQGTPFSKAWRLKNEGSCTWDSGYVVVFHDGDLLSAPQTSPLPQVVPPGNTVDITLQMKAPDGGGDYYSNWELQNSEGQRFGVGKTGTDYFWTRIQVSWLAPGESAPPSIGEISPPSGSSATGTVCGETVNPVYIQQVIQLINQARIANGLPPLSEQPQLDAAAQSHSADMACNNHSSHTGSDGSTWNTRVEAQGYAATLVLENIYAGDPAFGGDPAGAVDWWLNSPVHYANIMNPEVTEIGVGYAYSENAEFKGRFTVDFARP